MNRSTIFYNAKPNNMKQFYFLLLFTCIATISFSQITEEKRNMINGMQNALVLELPDTDAKMAKKWWIAFMKDYDARTKKVKGGDELLSSNAELIALGGSAGVNVYARIDGVGSAVSHTVWFDLGEDKGYLESSLDEDKYIEGEKFLMRFALYVTKEKILIELDEEEKELKSLQNETDKLVREKENFLRDIEQAKERIAKAEAGIEDNLKNQELNKATIENQKEVIEEVKKRLSEM